MDFQSDNQTGANVLLGILHSDRIVHILRLKFSNNEIHPEFCFHLLPLTSACSYEQNLFCGSES